MTAYTRVAIVIREKFIRPKILGIEVQDISMALFLKKDLTFFTGFEIIELNNEGIIP